MSNMPNNGYNQQSGSSLDRLMQELNEDSRGLLDEDFTGSTTQQYTQQYNTVQQPVSYPQQVQNPAPMPMPVQPVQQAYPQQPDAYSQQRRFNRRTTNGYAFSFGDEEQNEVPVQPQPVQPEPEPAASKRSGRPSTGKLVRDSIILAGMIIIFTLTSMIMLPSGIKKTADSTDQKSFFEDLDSEFRSFKSDSVGAIFEIPKVYILPWGEQPAPVPTPEGYSSYVDENGVEILTYEDPTISVKYWRERLYKSNVHFAEIKVAHPTQLRTAYAGGEFGSSVKYMPQEIAQHVNAVIAINADYCGYRTGGIIYRQNNLYRNTPRGWDVLLIDSDGNFHIMADTDVHPSGIQEQYEIVNSLEFGPSLVVDGEIKLINIKSGCGPKWNEEAFSPRTGVGQLGELHYLFCVVEGRTDETRGVYTSQLAQIMYDKGCIQAYNLDGGQSTTMILGGQAMNEPLWGAQRVVTDILYCATAIPNEEAAANE